MQPITRVSVKSFCRSCLQDLTPKSGEYNISEKEDLEKWLQAATGIQLNERQISIFPNKICFACYVKARIYQEYKMKTYCAGEVIKQVTEEQYNNEPVLRKLATVCRICLNYMQPAKSVNMFENNALLNWLTQTSIVRLQDESSENMPKFVCNKCYKHLNVNLEFQCLARQSMEYLKNILELTSEEIEGASEVKTNNDNESIEKSHEINVDAIKVEQEDLHKSSESIDSDLLTEPLLICKIEIGNESIKIEDNEDCEPVKLLANKKVHNKTINRRLTRSSSRSSQCDDEKYYYNEELGNNNLRKRKFDFYCEECDKKFSVQWIYEGHMRGHLGDSRPYHCTECTKTFRHQSDIYPHLYGVHNFTQKLKTGRYAAEAERLTYKCEFCCKVFKRKDHYRDHVDSVHHMIKRFACSYCPRRFSLARTMRLHEMRHTGECPFVCETCGRRFRKTTDLNVHMEMHTTPPELLCPICKRAKSSLAELSEHIAMHEQHQCTKCGLLFKRASHLRQHDRAVHLKIRPFKCKYCEKSFALSGTCQAHERVHTGERPQICNVCGVSYKTKRGLQSHVERHELNGADTKTRKKRNQPPT